MPTSISTGCVEGVQPRDHRRLVQADAEPVAELQAEARLLVGEAELLAPSATPRRSCRWSSPGARGRSRVEPLAALLVGVELGGRRVAHGERAVVARPVAHERVDDVEERLVAGPQQAVGERVRMRVAAIARDGVDRLDVLGAELEEEPASPRRRPGSLSRPGAASGRSRRRPHRRSPAAWSSSAISSSVLILRASSITGCASAMCDARALQREQRRHVGDVDAERLAGETALEQLVGDMRGERIRHARLVGHRAAHGRHPGAPARLRQPGRVQLVVLGRRAEVPEDRVAVARTAARSGRSCRAPTSPMCVLVT